MKTMIAVLLAATALFAIPASGHASCPDRVTCFVYVHNPAYPGFYEEWRGNISTPTCWKAGHQCKPWNCSGNSTNADDWVDNCIQQFNIKAKFKGDEACVVFPEFKHEEKSLSGFGRHCKTLPTP